MEFPRKDHQVGKGRKTEHGIQGSEDQRSKGLSSFRSLYSAFCIPRATLISEGLRASVAFARLARLGSFPGMERCWRSSANRAIRTSKLNALLRLHTWPIDVVVFHGSQAKPGFEVSFPLRCFQRLSRPHIATRQCRWRDNRSTRGASIPVLSY